MYYVYGHFLDNKCIYIGSNCMGMSKTRAYDFSDRNDDYKKVTAGRKDEIEVRILKEFKDVKYIKGLNGIIQSEELKLIAHYHDIGEALCSHQDARGRYHSKETRHKMSINHADVRGIKNPMYNKSWNKGIKLSNEFKSKISKGLIEKYKNNPEIRMKISKANSGENNGRACRCMLKHYNTEISFNTLSELYAYCKDNYNIGGSIFKKLLDTQQPYIPRCKRHEKARGLTLRRL